MLSSNQSNQFNSAHSPEPAQGEEIIEIEVGYDGAIKVDPLNFQGAECETATASLYEVLGDVVDKDYKPEYFSPDPNNRQGTAGRSSARQ